MEVSGDFITRLKKFFGEAFGLAYVEGKDILNFAGQKTLYYLAASLLVVLSLGWFSVAVFLLLVSNATLTPIQSSVLIATAFLIISGSVVYASSKLSVKSSQSVQETFNAFLQKENFLEASEQLKDAAADALNPVKIVQSSIMKNPMPYLLGGVTLGLALATKDKLKGVHT